MDPRLWWNGEVVPCAEAKMHVTAESAMRGINAFEGLRAYWQPDRQRFAIVSFGPHLDRLKSSLKLLHLPAAHLVESLADAVRELLALAEPGRDYYLRPTVYLEKGSYTASASLCQFGSFVSCRDVPPAGAPLACHISSYTRVAASAFPPRAKSGAAYAMFRLARIEAAAQGCDEAILLDADRRVTETGGAAIFAVLNGRVTTPDLSHAILDGITRRHAIRILEERLDRPVAQRAISVEDLLRAGEVFLAGTLDEVRSVISISGGRKRLEQDVGAAVRAEYVGICRGRHPPLDETMLEYVSPGGARVTLPRQPPVDPPEAWRTVFDRFFHRFWHEELGGDRLESDLAQIRLACDPTPRTRVLDLGCGYGRIANRLAAEGIPVTGVDQSAELLDLARAAAADPAPTYVEGDMREAQADEAFDIAILWGTTFGYFTDRENLSVLQGVYRSLRPGGSLVIETRNWDRIDRDFSAWTVRRSGSDFLIERHEFVPSTARQKTDQVLLIEGGRRCRSYSLRRYTAAELVEVLRLAGFESVTVNGEDMNSLTVDHKRMIVVATRGGAE